MSTQPEQPADQFTAALRADVVIEGVTQPGPLPVADILATRDWFDRRRQAGAERADDERPER